MGHCAVFPYKGSKEEALHYNEKDVGHCAVFPY